MRMVFDRLRLKSLPDFSILRPLPCCGCYSSTSGQRNLGDWLSMEMLNIYHAACPRPICDDP
jgi:hypothetical protein